MTDGVAYRSTGRGAGSRQKLHADADCPTLPADEPVPVSLSTIPESHREWCSRCGADGGPTRPADGYKKHTDVCDSCGQTVPALMMRDGVCLGCLDSGSEVDA